MCVHTCMCTVCDIRKWLSVSTKHGFLGSSPHDLSLGGVAPRLLFFVCVGAAQPSVLTGGVSPLALYRNKSQTAALMSFYLFLCIWFLPATIDHVSMSSLSRGNVCGQVHGGSGCGCGSGWMDGWISLISPCCGKHSTFSRPYPPSARL